VPCDGRLLKTYDQGDIVSKSTYEVLSVSCCLFGLLVLLSMANPTFMPAFGYTGMIVVISTSLILFWLSFYFDRKSREPSSKRFPRGHPWRL
jgi:uncharacterized membrane protein